MRLDAIEGFELRGPLELTQENPVGLVTSEITADRSLLVKEICKSEDVSNIIYYGSAEDVPYVVGRRVIHKSTQTKDVFNKIDEMCRFCLATGFKVSTLIVFDNLSSAPTLRDPKVQCDLVLLLDRCKQYNIRILFIHPKQDEGDIEILRLLLDSRGIDAINYSLIVQRGSHYLCREWGNILILNNQYRHFCINSRDAFNKLTLWVNKVGNCGELREVSSKEIKGVENILYGKEDGGLHYIFVVEDADLIESCSMETWLRDKQSNHHFILITPSLPSHLIHLVDTI